jgi:hypothetical protein
MYSQPRIELLTVTPKPTKVSTVTICSGETYTWAANATAYTVSGTYTTKLNDGCTANQIGVDRYSKPTKVSSVTICSGEILGLRTQRLHTVSGTYTKLNDGCTAAKLVLTTLNQPKFLPSDHLLW